MTYSHMGKPHTTIGADPFHFWVRNGFRWFQIAMVAKQKGCEFVWSLYSERSDWSPQGALLKAGLEDLKLSSDCVDL